MQQAWPHQAYGVDELNRRVKDGASNVCLTSPTGGGKSWIMFDFIRNFKGRVTLYTYRTLLFDQIATEMEKAGIEFGKISPREEGTTHGIQLAMSQTQITRCVNKGRMVHPSEAIIFDEAHQQVGPKFVKLRELHSSAIDIGITATPIDVGHVYDDLIVAGNVRELRECGALVMNQHYGPDEPDLKWIGKVKDEGECGIMLGKRKQFAQRVFGSVLDNYHEINPDRRPTILFAPGVEESVWMCQRLNENGIPAAHVDSELVWLGGEMYKRTKDIMDDIKYCLEIGELLVICNRFVLREGIDWPFVSHGIFATVFGSLTSYMQAGGRYLRACAGKDFATLQDHGGNWHRFGSLNFVRQFNLTHTNAQIMHARKRRLQNNEEHEPTTCPKCKKVMLLGRVCSCGYVIRTKSRRLLQSDGTLREHTGDVYRTPRRLKKSRKIEQQWKSRVYACMNSKKEHVRRMTFAQLEAAFARDNNFCFPPHDLPMMPINHEDWCLPPSKVSELTR